MIVWCSYCQRFMGEKEPYSDLSMTHTICEQCKKGRKTRNFDASLVQPIIHFYEQLRRNLKTFKGDIDWNDVLKKAEQLKIQPNDLLIGIIQPLLFEIGQMYANGKITTVHEHIFTSNVERLLFQLESREQKHFPPSYDILLACTDGNYHVLGLRFIQFYLNTQNLPCKTLFPSIPSIDLFQLIQVERPKILGLSVTTESHLEGLKHLLKLFEVNPGCFHPCVLLGGQAAASAAQLSEKITLYTNRLNDLVPLIHRLLGKEAGKVGAPLPISP